MSFGMVSCILGHMAEFTWRMFGLSRPFLGVMIRICTALAGGFPYHCVNECHSFRMDSRRPHGLVRARDISSACAHPIFVRLDPACRMDWSQERAPKQACMVCTCTQRIPAAMPNLRLATGSTPASSKMVISGRLCMSARSGNIWLGNVAKCQRATASLLPDVTRVM